MLITNVPWIVNLEKRMKRLELAPFAKWTWLKLRKAKLIAERYKLCFSFYHDLLIYRGDA